jgi:hypothetical protein
MRILFCVLAALAFACVTTLAFGQQRKGAGCTTCEAAVVRIEASQVGNLWYAEVFNVDGVLLHTTPLFGTERTAILAAHAWSDSPAIPDCECGPCKCDVCECTLTLKAEANCCTQRNPVQHTLMHRQPIRVIFVRVFHRRCR